LGSPSDWRVIYSTLDEATAVAILTYVLWKRGSGLGQISRSFRWRDLVFGLALFFVGRQLSRLVAYVIAGAWQVSSGRLPVHVDVGQILGIHASSAWLIYQLINPWCEELIVRGFLTTEINALVGMRTAIVVSTLVQASYHLYQGAMNAAIVSVIFLIFSLYYARTRRLGPVIVAHTTMDLWYYIAVGLRR
jgi:membrane protease YdiL (CAAX protease family)